MKQKFTASLARENGWVIAQCLEIDVASQGRTEAEALANLREALELHLEAPTAEAVPVTRVIDVDVGAA